MMKLFFAACLLLTCSGSAAPATSSATEARVTFIRSQPDVLWQARLNPSLQGGAMQRLLGVPADYPRTFAAAVEAGDVQKYEPRNPNLELPVSFDAAEHWPECASLINTIRDQSDCGCCWAFGAAECASDHMCIASGGAIKVPLSTQDMCFCGSVVDGKSDGCGGGRPSEAWAWIKSNGLVSGGQNVDTDTESFCSSYSLPKCHHHGPVGADPYPAENTTGCPEHTAANTPMCPTACDANAKAPHNVFADDKYSFKGDIVTPEAGNVTQIMQLMYEAGPVEAVFLVSADFEQYSSGIYHHVTGAGLGFHAVKIVGWGVENGTDYWKVANSWNKYWGEDGFFRIRKGSEEEYLEYQVIAAGPGANWGPMKAIQK